MLNIPPLSKSKKHNFIKMKIGDYKVISFDTKKELLKAQVYAHSLSRMIGCKFVTRSNGLDLQVWCKEEKPDPFFG